MTFEDSNGIEKISYLSQKLPAEGEPDGCDPDVGVYAPLGKSFHLLSEFSVFGQLDYVGTY